MCIDICPVGALTSGSYRYKTRPWEMKHVSTVCTHCGDGCKVTLGVRAVEEGTEIIRADNRDKSGINGDFLCAKGRFGFDFVDSEQRLTKPLVRNAKGELEPTTWENALRIAGAKLKEIRDSGRQGGSAIGVIGSNRTTNEENYLLQKFARTVLKTNNIDHRRTADYAAFAQAMAGHTDKAASLRDAGTAPAILLVGGNPTEEHPLLAWQLRTNVRLNKARLYVVNHRTIKLERQAKAVQGVPPAGYKDLTALLDKQDERFCARGDGGGVAAGGVGRGVPRGAVEGACGVGTEARQCAFCVPGGSCELARRGGHGRVAGFAAGVCAGERAGGVCGGVCGHAADSGHDDAGDVGSDAPGESWARCWWWARIRWRMRRGAAESKDTFLIVQDLFLDGDGGAGGCGVSGGEPV